MSYILSGLGSVLSLVLNLILLLVFAQVILSWVGDQNNNIIKSINKLCEPLYKPFRKLLKQNKSGIDFAPFIVIIIVVFLQASLVRWLFRF